MELSPVMNELFKLLAFLGVTLGSLILWFISKKKKGDDIQEKDQEKQ